METERDIPLLGRYTCQTQPSEKHLDPEGTKFQLQTKSSKDESGFSTQLGRGRKCAFFKTNVITHSYWTFENASYASNACTWQYEIEQNRRFWTNGAISLVVSNLSDEAYFSRSDAV